MRCVGVKYDLAIPESEADAARFDWAAFPPAAANRKTNFFLIVDEATGIKGKLVTWTSFIHGEVDGLVFAEHVQVEETGRVRGVIFCRTLTVMGKVSADVTCDALHVRGQGVLSGTVRYRTARIEGAGQVTGTFTRRTGEPERVRQQA